MSNTSNTHYLVQANYGIWDIDNVLPEQFQDFSNRGGEIMKQASPDKGFVWAGGTRFYGDEAVTEVFDNPNAILNLSVWRSYECLKQFVYDGNHHKAMKVSRNWFKKLDRKVYVLWWIKASELPTVVQAKEKLDLINTEGVGPDAFDFHTVYDEIGHPYII